MPELPAVTLTAECVQNTEESDGTFSTIDNSYVGKGKAKAKS